MFEESPRAPKSFLISFFRQFFYPSYCLSAAIILEKCLFKKLMWLLCVVCCEPTSRRKIHPKTHLFMGKPEIYPKTAFFAFAELYFIEEFRREEKGKKEIGKLRKFFLIYLRFYFVEFFYRCCGVGHMASHIQPDILFQHNLNLLGIVCGRRLAPVFRTNWTHCSAFKFVFIRSMTFLTTVPIV